MTRNRALLGVFGVLLVLLALVPARGVVLAQGPSEGQYICRGSVAEKSYELDLTVTKGLDVYLFTWSKLGSMAMGGQGLEQDGYFSVLFIDAKGSIGLGMYRFTPGRLDGRWTGGDGEVHTETCTRGSDL